MKAKFLSMLGLAQRAGKIASGEFSAEQSVKKHKSHLILVAEDASENTKKSFLDLAKRGGVAYYAYGTKEELGEAIGKEFRASLSVEDENFAAALVKILESCKTE